MSETVLLESKRKGSDQMPVVLGQEEGSRSLQPLSSLLSLSVTALGTMIPALLSGLS